MVHELMVVALGAVSGLLIGCIGIGGVLLVPCLALSGIEIHDAIAVSMFSYIFAGAVAVLIFWGKGSIQWSSAGWLCASAMPAAFFGALAASVIRASALEALVGLAVLFSGVRAFTVPHMSNSSRVPSRIELLAIGLITGFGSALTGTGGPFVLVPILIWFSVPILTVVGLSQAIQIPIALLATLGNALYGRVDLPLGALLSVGLVAGTGAGAFAAHAAPAKFLIRFVGIVLLGLGALFLIRFIRQLV
jgi:uncharacterized membrane protein YfcA